MKFYTSVLPYRGRLLVRGVNHDGSHKKYRVNYRPSLFVPSNKESKYKTLDGRNAGKIDFDSSVGIGEHPQFIEEMDKQLEKMSNAEEKLTTLNKHFNNTQI